MALKVKSLVSIVLALAGVSVIFLVIASITDYYWHGSHSTATTFTVSRPECPTSFSGTTIPGMKKGQSVPDLITIDKSGLPVSGPITDIAEFHDCQKFVSEDGKSYESLMAVFASDTLEKVTNSLALDSVVWTTSNATKASVSSHGVVTAIAAGGPIIIMATSQSDVNRTAKLLLTVDAAAPLGQSDALVLSAGGAPASYTLAPGQTLRLSAAVSAATAATEAVAEIYNYGLTYTHLGIGPNFSCLYLYVDGSKTLVARMVPVGELGTSPHACATLNTATLPEGTTLKVFRTNAADAAEFPAAARWDFDPLNKRYYVGLKCGTGWCEIGHDGPVGPFTPSASLTPGAGLTPGQRRMMLGKGWYDQQVLATYGGADSPPTPSGLVGTVVPHAMLASYTLNTYKNGVQPDASGNAPSAVDGNWVPTGYVGITETGTATSEQKQWYKSNFGFDVIPIGDDPTKANSVSMCYGTNKHCGVPLFGSVKSCGILAYLLPWPKRAWAKFQAPGSTTAVFRCVTRREHKGSDATRYIMPTARWRWVAIDETIWEYCDVAGCCETSGGGR